tara:strand:- start:649 stop:1080 length:432 start_codon:yes stop_codon:yes gene_type:complete
MANMFRQRLIKPGRDFNYAEGVKVLNATTSIITTDTVVMATGFEGPFLKVTTAVGTAKGARGRLLILKHDLPASGYGVGLPWKLVVTALDFSGGAVGDQVFISDASAPALSAGTKSRVIGHVIDISATAGAYLFSGELGDQAA